jgi:DNA repair protein RadD
MMLRWYQAEAKKAVYDYLGANKTGNPCVVLPTGSGKTPLLASICADVAQWGGRVVVVAHVKELLQQSANKLREILPAEMVGVYSAGLGEKTHDAQITVAGIQSAYKKAGLIGKKDLVIVDEAHLIPSHDGGMYREFIAGMQIVNPSVRVVGFTATPFRLDCGMICGGEDSVLDAVVYEASVKQLIVQGYLSPIRMAQGKAQANLDEVHVRGGEYVESEVAEAMIPVVAEAVGEAVGLCSGRRRILVFCSSVEHAKIVREAIIEFTGEECGIVFGDMPSGEREHTIGRFNDGSLRWLVNMNVLTTGFDCPSIDAIVLMRATLSPGLYCQMVGRGLRIAEGKHDCIVLDYGSNALRHGPIDDLHIDEKTGRRGGGDAPMKFCPQCRELLYAAASVCTACHYRYPDREPKHEGQAQGGEIISGEKTVQEHKVYDVRYYIHEKKGAPDAPKTMRVEYQYTEFPPMFRKEWVCVEHSGRARSLAETWWRMRSNAPCPATAKEAAQIANAGGLAPVRSIKWQEGGGEKFGRVIDWDIGSIPEWHGVIPASVEDDWGEIPF